MISPFRPGVPQPDKQLVWLKHIPVDRQQGQGSQLICRLPHKGVSTPLLEDAAHRHEEYRKYGTLHQIMSLPNFVLNPALAFR